MEPIPAGFGMANDFEAEKPKEDGFCPRISRSQATLAVWSKNLK
jgi:hypothetical protein